jgi:hypothetical protein
LDVPETKTKLFTDESLAKDYSLKYHKYIPLYAITKVGAQIRKIPNMSSPALSPLKNGQIVKIIDLDSNFGLVGGEDGYWYKVITEDGITGYIFSSYLTVVRKENNRFINLQTESPEPIIDNFLQHSWQPAYLRDDFKRGDLDVINTKNIGLFPNQKSHSVHIRTPNYEIRLHYQYIEKVFPNVLFLHGTPLLVEVEGKGEILAKYNWQGRGFLERYTLVNK